MKKFLLLTMCLLMVSSAALADHIGVYSDGSASSCNLGNIAGQFSPTATVIHKFATGATTSDFNITFPPGTAFFGFNSPYIPVPVVQPTGGISLGYGQCRTGNIVLGSINAIYAIGTAQIVHSDSFANILYTDCSFASHSATGGTAYVGTTGNCNEPLPVEPSTWGSVKALYR